MSSGYPDLDTGLPVLRYTRDLLTPQAWVGVYAYPGNDPKWFLDQHAKVTKRWAEQLRFQRGDNDRRLLAVLRRVLVPPQLSARRRRRIRCLRR